MCYEHINVRFVLVIDLERKCLIHTVIIGMSTE